MSWLYSRALVGEYSGASCSGGELSVPLSVMPTPHRFWLNDKTTECSSLSRFGLTCAVLTESRGAELLTLFLAGSPAPTYPQREEAQGLTERNPGFGEKWPALLAKFDPASCSWKTAQCSLFADLEQYLETWPRWGSMRNGECFQRQNSAHLTSENESGLWPTPDAS